MGLRRFTIKTRVAFFFALVNAAILCLFSMAVFSFYAESVQTGVESVLKSEYETFRNDALSVSYSSDRETFRNSIASKAEYLAERGFAVFVTDTDGIGAISDQDYLADFSRLPRNAVSTVSIRGEPYLFYVGDVPSARIAVGVSQWLHVTSKLAILSRILIIFVLFGTVLGFFVSGLIAEMVLSPLARLASDVDAFHPDSSEGLSLAEKYPNDSVRVLAAAFDRFADRIRRFLEREKEFVSDVGHELRTPLTVVQTSAELLLAKDPTDWQKGKIKLVLDSTERMNRMTNELLELSREGVSNHSKSDVDMAKFAASLEAGLKPFAESKGVELSFRWKGFKIQANDSDLSKVLSNLIKNAIVHSGSKKVECAYSPYEFRVKDYGKGIAPDELPKIWGRFYRSEKSRSPAEGFGLGLAIVKKIAEREGWNIDVESKLKKGTEFTVRFAYFPPVDPES